MGSWSVYEAVPVGRPSIILHGAPIAQCTPIAHTIICHPLLSFVTLCQAAKLCHIVWYCIIVFGTVWYCLALCGTVFFCGILFSGPQCNGPANPRKGIAQQKQDIKQKSKIPHWSPALSSGQWHKIFLQHWYHLVTCFSAEHLARMTDAVAVFVDTGAENKLWPCCPVQSVLRGKLRAK